MLCRQFNKQPKMAFMVTSRSLALLVLATFFFLALYTLAGIPQQTPKFIQAPTITLDVDEIVSNVSLERNWPCQKLYQDFNAPGSSRRHSKPQTLYQPPCPLGDFEEFQHLINTDICGSDSVYMLVLVGSHPANTELRDVIRQTWGQPNINGFPFRVAFTFGQLTNNDQQIQLELESQHYGDVLQGNFIDSYRNVTLRDLMGLRWAWQYCRQAKFVMHADDDVSIDIYGLIDALEGQFGNTRDFVGCFQMMVNTPVLRTGKYTVTKAEHPSDIYDPYCQGWMYIVTPHMAYRLDVAALKVPTYWMNDAYITGTLVKALGQVPSDLNVNYTINVIEMQEVQNLNPNMQPRFTVGPTGANGNLTRKLHENYRNYAILVGLPKLKWTKRQHRKKTKRLKRLNFAQNITNEQNL